MATLNQIASTIRTIAQTNLKRGITRAYKTGNLYRRVGASNPANKMVKETNKSVNISLDYAPSGAIYGKFVNDGTTKMASRPFATNAINDPVVDKMLNDWVETNLIGGVVKELTAEIDTLGR